MRMKKTTAILTFPIVLLAILSGCADPTAVSTGSLQFSIAVPQASARTALPALGDRTPTIYAITGSGPGGTTFSISGNGLSQTATDLAPGSWVISVSARNAASIEVGSGNATGTVTAGSTATVGVTILPVTGTGATGTLYIDLQWPSTSVATPSITSTLTKSGGSPQTLTIDAPMSGVTTYSASHDAGAHVLKIDLFDTTYSTETPVCSIVEAVIIYKSLTTTATFHLGASQIKSPPTAPTGLTATVVSASQIDLSWTDNAVIEMSYDVWRKTGSGGAWAAIAEDLAVNTVVYQSTGLAKNTQYYFRVLAHNSYGDSAWSNEANATTLNTCSLMVNVAPGGSVTTDPSGTVAIGTSYPIVATPDSGNHFVNWTVVSGGTLGTDIVIGNTSLASTTVTVNTGDSVIQANFGENWTLSTVDSTGNVGMWTSIELYGDNPRISYQDYTNTALKYASYSGTAWTTETVNSAGSNDGAYSSLSVDADGKPRIAYQGIYPDGTYPYNHYNLMYSEYNGSTWTNSTLIQGTFDSTYGDQHVQAGYYTSIAVDGSNNPRISYAEYYGGSPNYASQKQYNGGWLAETHFDTSTTRGQYSSIAYSGTTPHISYYDYSNGNLRYAYYNGTSWQILAVDSADDVGQWTSIAVDGSGKVHISYYDVTNTNLKYATNKTGLWVHSTVETSTGDVGKYSSLHLDSNGNPSISYFDATNGDLKFAWYSGSAWGIETVDSSESIGMYTSLEIDSSDRAHISYYDATNGDLKYAKRYQRPY